MKNKSYKKQIKEYREKYGNIPIDHDDILRYLEEELKLSDKDFKRIEEDEKIANSIPWRELTIILPVVPRPAPRPRRGKNGSFYVNGASENEKLFKYYIEEKYQIIYTRTFFSVTSYIPTPMSSMNRWEIYRAEKGNIAATSNPDWDNLGKTYSDMIQSILLLNDNIITKGLSEKYYSVKPRVEINIKYQEGFDSKYNKRRITSSKKYKDAVEAGHLVTLYTEGNGF